MKKLISMLLACLIFTCVAFTGVDKVDASNSESLVSEAVTQYVDENKAVFIEAMLSSGCFIYDKKNSTGCEFYLGKPYIIYLLAEKQDEIYYYPIVETKSNEIVANVGVIGTENGYSFEIQTEHCKILNEIDYLNNETVVYKENDVIYALTAEYRISIDAKGVLQTEKTSVTDQMNKIVNKLERLEKFSEKSLSDDEKLKLNFGTTLNLTNPRGQYSYNMCWASSAATIINHLKSSSVTGFDVCNRVGISYNAGGNMYDLQDGLSAYSVSYTAMRSSALTWAQITTNINAGKPAAMGAYPSSGTGHMTVLCGYNSSSTKTIVMWNPYLNSGNGGYSTINFSGGVYTMNGTTYQWSTSLSYS